jgi:hypothetical protein
MYWRRIFCFSVHSTWEKNLKSFPFKVVLSSKQCSLSKGCIDQIGFGYLISKHEMSLFWENTAFKTFKFLLVYLIFWKTVQTVRSKFSLNESCKQHHIRIDIPYLEKRTIRGRYSKLYVISAGSHFTTEPACRLELSTHVDNSKA